MFPGAFLRRVGGGTCLPSLLRKSSSQHPSPTNSVKDACSDNAAGYDAFFEKIRELVRLAKCGDEAANLPVEALHRLMDTDTKKLMASLNFPSIETALRRKPDWFELSGDAAIVTLRETAFGPRSSEETLLQTQHTVHTVYGATRNGTVDISTPPISAADLKAWELPRLVLREGLHFYPNCEPAYLVPPEFNVPLLAPPFVEIDELYRSKGLPSPSEMAMVFVPATPTFYVEVRHVMNALPAEVRAGVENFLNKNRTIIGLLRKYPMIFKVKQGKYQRSAIKLNMNFPFIAEHPQCRVIDKVLYKHNMEYNAGVGGVLSRSAPVEIHSGNQTGPGTMSHQQRRDVDLEIFRILVRNLPRQPSPSSGCTPSEWDAVVRSRYRLQPIVQWVNQFPQHDIDALNTVPQERVLTIISRYSRIFQFVMAGDPLDSIADKGRFAVYREAPLKKKAPEHHRSSQSESRQSPQELFPKCSTSQSASQATEVEASGSTRDSGNQGPLPPEAEDSGVVEEDSPQCVTGVDVEAQKRVARFQAAIQEELVGLDELLDDSKVEMFDKTADEADLDENCSGGAADENHLADCDDGVFGLVDEDGENAAAAPEAGEVLSSEFGGSRVASGGASASHVTDDGEAHVVLLDKLMIRRLPNGIAPRSLSNYNCCTSPEPDIVRHVSSFLGTPPSQRGVPNRIGAAISTPRSVPRVPGGQKKNLASCQSHDLSEGGDAEIGRWQNNCDSPAGTQSTTALGWWRWVPIKKIYASLTEEQKRTLRVYYGLVNFIRLHGEEFEVSSDHLYVIRHDPTGEIPPLIPVQKTFRFEERVKLPSSFDDDEMSRVGLIGEDERRKYERILGASQIPTDRTQLRLLDPLNPLLHYDILEEEIACFLPDHPVSTHQLLSRLPPIMKAALGVKFRNLFRKGSRHFTTWEEGSRTMVAKANWKVPRSALEFGNISIEDAVEAMRECVPIEGIRAEVLSRAIPPQPREKLRVTFGSIFSAAASYPQYFHLQTDPRGSKSDTMVFLVESMPGAFLNDEDCPR